MTHPARPLFRLAAVAGVAAALAACGVAPLDAQWKDPSRPAESLRTATVLVVCEAEEPVVKQMCQDRVSAELRALGANTALVPSHVDATPTRLTDEARRVDARAIFVTRVTPDTAQYGSRSGMSVGFGLGGGFGGRGFGGVGISAPLGGSRITQGYAANASLSDAASGRLMWTGKATTPTSDNLNWQLESLTKAVVGGAQQAGFF